MTATFDKLFINGAWVPSTSTETIEVFDSTDESVMATVPAGTADDVTAAVAAAAALPVSQWEPELMSDTELRALEREPRPEGTPAVTGLSDRSWFWAMVLILMMAESWLRERRA